MEEELLRDVQKHVLNSDNLILTTKGIIEMDKPVTIFAQGYIENEAMRQFNSAMETEHVVKGALMPDTHTGYSLPIGAVVQTKNYVYPSWVGYDIGCGVCAVRTNYFKEDIEQYSQEIFEAIYKHVPVGAAKHKRSGKISSDGLTKEGTKIFASRSAGKQLGTLGGGNHFIEIGIDGSNYVWIIIHSGSRGVGHGIAGHYMKLASNDVERLKREWEENNPGAVKYNSTWKRSRDRAVAKTVSKGKAKEGHYGFQVDTKMGQDYLQDMNWCLDYALKNRRKMLDLIEYAINETLCTTNAGIQWSTLINRTHNHAEVSSTDNTVIHRKGATHAEKDMLGVIPGNMRDGSFIVRGRGNESSLNSCSHGAGRVLSRSKAKSTLDYKEFQDTMVGITAKVAENQIDEAPAAYKNIFDVMDAQKDLVEIIHHVKPIINIKA